MIHSAAIISNCIYDRDVYIGAYCVVGDPAENLKTWNKTPYGVKIYAGAVLTKLVTIDCGTIRDTIIGKNVMIMAGGHVGHDAVIGDNVVIACGAKVGGHVEIGTGCNLGLNSVAHPRVKIPPYCMIGANAIITKNLQTIPFGVYAGNPAKFIKMNEIGIEKAGLSKEDVERITKEWNDIL